MLDCNQSILCWITGTKQCSDVNEDGALNVLDVVMLVGLILGGDFDSNGDMNADGVLNVLDIVALVNLILS